MAGSTSSGSRFWRATALAGALVAVLLAPTRAAAKANGLAVTDCSGCHSGGKETTVTITPSLTTFQPGATLTLTVSIATVNGSQGGVYFQATPGVGKLSLVPGEPTKLSGDNGATHSSPKSSADGKFVTFAFRWTAPSTPSGVEFKAYGLSTNGNSQSSGDGPGQAYLSEVFGCAGIKYYQDNDGDGYGSPDGNYRLACAQPTLYAPSNDDCDDSLETTHPGATELCNAKDDDCDGQVDEGLTVSNYCPDKDGDGHGVTPTVATMMVMGCGPSKGFGLCDNDCNDADQTVYPSAQESCNYRDDNCNGRVDENARMTCGEGWCQRSSEGCSASLCEPGPPRSEECNALDDDCDGVVDDGSALCPAGRACVDGSCSPFGAPTDAGVSVARADAAAPLRLPDGALAPTSEPYDRAANNAGCTLTSRGDALMSAGRAWCLLTLTLALVLRRTRRS